MDNCPPTKCSHQFARGEFARMESCTNGHLPPYTISQRIFARIDHCTNSNLHEWKFAPMDICHHIQFPSIYLPEYNCTNGNLHQMMNPRSASRRPSWVVSASASEVYISEDLSSNPTSRKNGLQKLIKLMSQEWVHYAQAISTVITSQNDGLGSQGGLIIFYKKNPRSVKCTSNYCSPYTAPFCYFWYS